MISFVLLLLLFHAQGIPLDSETVWTIRNYEDGIFLIYFCPFRFLKFKKFFFTMFSFIDLSDNFRNSLQILEYIFTISCELFRTFLIVFGFFLCI